MQKLRFNFDCSVYKIFIIRLNILKDLLCLYGLQPSHRCGRDCVLSGSSARPWLELTLGHLQDFPLWSPKKQDPASINQQQRHWETPKVQDVYLPFFKPLTSPSCDKHKLMLGYTKLRINMNQKSCFDVSPFDSRFCMIVCRLLQLGLEGKVIRSQDLSSLILMVARNPKGHYLAWNFVKKNWDELVEKLVFVIGKMENTKTNFSKW